MSAKLDPVLGQYAVSHRAYTSNGTSPITDRLNRSPKTCCWIVRLRMLLLLILVVIRPFFHFTPKLPFTCVQASVKP